MIVIPACGVLTASNAVGAEKFQRLTGSQIRAKFAGMEVTDEVRWRDIYERDGTLRSGEWGKIFSDQAMTLAAIDRLVHHATILEMNVESYRRKAALKRKRGSGD